MISKPLMKADVCSKLFEIEILEGDMVAGINFDSIMKHPLYGYMLFEYQKCEPTQTVTPHTSNPNRYWVKCYRKYKSLWEITKKLEGNLFVVNYADKDTVYENLVKIFRVLDVSREGITFSYERETTKKGFSIWFRKHNKECLNEN